LLLLIPLGTEINGAKSWIKLGGFSIQPSEFAKVGACLAVAKYLDDRSSQFRYGLNKESLILYAMILFMPALIMLQPDAGSALVYSSFILMMCIDGLSFAIPILGIVTALLFILTNLYFKVEELLIAILVIGTGISFFQKKFDFGLNALISVVIVLVLFSLPVSLLFFLEDGNLIVIGIYSVILIVGFVNVFFRRKLLNFNTLIIGLSIVSFVVIGSSTIFNKLPSHHQNRLRVLQNPNIDPRGKGWNIIQSNIAISSGGVFGKGFKEGTITKGNWVPEQHTDFIFCTIGEEHGFLGTTMVIILFVALIIRLGAIAQRQKSRFSQVYGYSVMGIIFFHFLINVGMVIGLLPVIGIPLPFFSYGGSSLWSFTILLTIMVKVDMHRSQILARS
jgi:rod shape determining protein RodA